MNVCICGCVVRFLFFGMLFGRMIIINWLVSRLVRVASVLT